MSVAIWRVAAGSICHDFATTRLALIPFIQRIRDFSSREICFYAVKVDYALYVAVGLRIVTVGVWGSNPHAPTNFLSNLATIASLSVTPIYAIQS
jgi:hypothetical protein